MSRNYNYCIYGRPNPLSRLAFYSTPCHVSIDCQRLATSTRAEEEGDADGEEEGIVAVGRKLLYEFIDQFNKKYRLA